MTTETFDTNTAEETPVKAQLSDAEIAQLFRDAILEAQTRTAEVHPESLVRKLRALGEALG